MNRFKLSLLIAIYAHSFTWAQEVSPALNAKPVNQTWSDFLQPLETDLNLQNQIFHDEMAKTNLLYKSFSSRKYIEKTITDIFSPVREIQTLQLSNGDMLKLIDQGLGKSIDLVRVTKTETQTLYSNFVIARNNSTNFLSFSISPSEKFAVIVAEQNGSIDDFKLIAYNLTTKSVIDKNYISKASDDTPVVWTGASKFSFPVVKGQFIDVDLEQSAEPSEPQTVSWFGRYPRNVRCDANNQAQYLNVALVDFPCGDWFQILTRAQDHVDVLRKRSENDIGFAVWRYSLVDGKSVTTKLNEITDYNFDEVTGIENFYAVKAYQGIDQVILLLSKDGELKEKIAVPGYASVTAMKSSQATQSIAITFQTQVTTDRTYVYNYVAHQWTTAPNEAADMTTKDGIPYVNQVVQVQMRDQTLVPIRLTYKKSVTPNSDTPFLMKIYGGYSSIDGGFYPSFNRLYRTLFMNRGGVVVTAALRGGAEFGPSWHDQASGLKRITTFHDIIDISQYLIDQKLTSAKKIILTGASAGGLATLASGFLAPQNFGLLLPIAPPTDVIGKIRLDSRYYEGQKKEYGDPALPEIFEAMKLYSPLELDTPSENLPTVLITAGLNDSRVNVLHTLKLMQKIRLNPIFENKVHVDLIKNSGHFLSGLAYQDLIAWRAQSLYWSQIYAYLSWQ